MMFRQGWLLRQYSSAYTLIKSTEGEWVGNEFQESPDIEVSLSGSIQPISMKLIQDEGGRYTMDDRILYSSYPHKQGDKVKYQGHIYTIDSSNQRDNSDVGKFTMKLVKK